MVRQMLTNECSPSSSCHRAGDPVLVLDADTMHVGIQHPHIQVQSSLLTIAGRIRRATVQQDVPHGECDVDKPPLAAHVKTLTGGSAICKRAQDVGQSP